MYNKIFTKILDSSIWLEADPTRIVWITMIAAMDEDGFCAFASVANLARRAVVDLDKAEEAVRVLEAPDSNSCDPDHEGRRIERVPGGWIVLNAQKYKELVTRVVARERTRLRVAKYRDKQNSCNADVTPSNVSVTQSETVSESYIPPLPPVGGNVTDVDEPDKPGRKRSPQRRLASARAELERVEGELQDIVRPGGCAYNVTPTGDKLKRYNKLMALMESLQTEINAAQDALT